MRFITYCNVFGASFSKQFNKNAACEILKGFKVNSPVWQCGVWYQG